jgi:hypothetical protein
MWEEEGLFHHASPEGLVDCIQISLIIEVVENLFTICKGQSESSFISDGMGSVPEERDSYSECTTK